MLCRILRKEFIRFKHISGKKKHSHPSLIGYIFQPTSKLYRQEKPAVFTSPRPLPHPSWPGSWSRLPRLTDEIRQQDRQEEGCGDGGQGGAFPAAVFRGLLQLEGLPREGIPGQQAGRWRVNGSWGQRVSRRRAAKQGCAPRGGLEEKVPGEEKGKSQHGHGWLLGDI